MSSQANAKRYDPGDARPNIQSSAKNIVSRDALKASLVLAVLLSTIFFSSVFGNKTLLFGVWDASTVMPTGAYQARALPGRIGRTPDAGAAAWQTEAWNIIINRQFWHEGRAPLWNPFSAYGTPLAAAMLPQPFYPLTALLSLDVTPWTYNLFVVFRLFLAGLLTFIFARLFLDFLPSLFTAISFMLTGYLSLNLGLPFLSVDVLLPGLFLSFELLLRKNSWGAVAGAAVVIFLCVLGGMPESLFLAVLFAAAYFLFRLATTKELRASALDRVGKLTAAGFLGFALSAFLLIPFLEFMRVAHDIHQPANLGGQIVGLGADSDARSLLLEFLPLAFGPVGNSIFSGFSGWTGLRGYWGVLPSVFGVAALLYCIARRPAFASPLGPLTIFFAAFLTLMLLKRFGHPVINWIGYLPISSFMIYQKYLEPLMAFCVVMLAGIGFSQLSEGIAGKRHLLVAIGLVLLVMLALAGSYLSQVLSLKDHAIWFYGAILSGILVALAAAALLSLSPSRARFAAWGFVALLAVELSFNFIVPSFYLFNTLPPASASPYAGAPYIDFLRARNEDRYRVFAREAVLYPNWSGVFELADVRGLDAMYYRRYMDFIRSFLGKPGDTRLHGDLADRFTGADGSFSYAFDTETERRFLALSSVKYLISISEYGPSANVADEILAQHKSEKLWGLGPGTFSVNGREVRGLFHHPPSKRLSYATTIRANRPILEGVSVIGKGAFDHSDGVGFLIEVESDGKIEPLFSTLLNPKEVAADRAGRPFRVDLSRFAGKPVKLLFSTDPGLSGNNGWDWAGWAGLDFAPVGGAAESGPFLEVYNEEVRIYEVPNVLPRASLFSQVEILPDSEVLERLKEPSFDPYQTVVLSREGLSDQDVTMLQAIKPSTVGGTARIPLYESQLVQIEVETPSPAILMLNDSNYPGWRAYVNGKPAPSLKADYLFRGVAVPEGKSTVEFSYEPISFRVGAMVSLGALVILLLPIVIRRRAHPSSPRRN